MGTLVAMEEDEDTKVTLDEKGNLDSLKRTCLEVYTQFVWWSRQRYPSELVGYPMKMHSLVLGWSLWLL